MCDVKSYLRCSVLSSKIKMPFQSIELHSVNFPHTWRRWWRHPTRDKFFDFTTVSSYGYCRTAKLLTHHKVNLSTEIHWPPSYAIYSGSTRGITPLSSPAFSRAKQKERGFQSVHPLFLRDKHESWRFRLVKKNDLAWTERSFVFSSAGCAQLGHGEAFVLHSGALFWVRPVRE